MVPEGKRPGRAGRLGNQDRPSPAPPCPRPSERPAVPGRHRPRPARQPALADIDPDSGRARLSYRCAAEVFKTASGGWTLHQLRHSRLTHLAESGVQLPILMAKAARPASLAWPSTPSPPSMPWPRPPPHSTRTGDDGEPQPGRTRPSACHGFSRSPTSSRIAQILRGNVIDAPPRRLKCWSSNARRSGPQGSLDVGRRLRVDLHELEGSVEPGRPDDRHVQNPAEHDHRDLMVEVGGRHPVETGHVRT